MRLSLTRVFVILAVVIGGTMGVNRMLIDDPAWRHVGVIAWATYSRHADLGNGLIVYPVEAISWAVLTIAAAVSFRFDRFAPRSAELPIYLGAFFMIVVMAITVYVAPIMISIGHMGNNISALERAFNQFSFWGVTVRDTSLYLAFLSSVWSLVALLSGTSNSPERGPTS